MESNRRTGPLSGVRVLEFAGLGPGPFASMMLADMGADVVRIESKNRPTMESGYTLRSRSSVDLDLKDTDDLKAAIALSRSAHIVIEGYRPGVMERLGLSPDRLLSENPQLVIGRMTGWGQEGPRSHMAGHDINFIAITGALHAMTHRSGDIVPPLNLVGDYGGGALFLVVGVLAALLHSRTTGKGQVVDAAICDGVSAMMGLFHQFQQQGDWKNTPQSNMLDGGAHFYGVYNCRDGKQISVGPIEPKFYSELLRLMNIEDNQFANSQCNEAWEQMRETLEQAFRQKDRDEWLKIFGDVDICVAPVHSIEDSRSDPHLVARKTFIEVGGEIQPAPAPRFSATPSQTFPQEWISVSEALENWSHQRSYGNPPIFNGVQP